MEAAIVQNSPTEATGHPKEMMLDNNLDTYWEPTTAGDPHVIEIDLGEAKTVDVMLFCIKNYKEISTGSIDRYWSDNGSSWTFVSGGPSLVDTATPIRINTTNLGLSHRYWKFDIAGQSHAVKVAAIWWGSYFNIAQGNVLPQGDEDQFFNRVGRLAGGRLAVAGINRNHVENPSRRYLVKTGTPYSNMLSAFQDSRGIRHLLIMNEGATVADARVVRFADNVLPHPTVGYDGLYEVGIALRGVPYVDNGDTF